jgi:hypothetical protein
MISAGNCAATSESDAAQPLKAAAPVTASPISKTRT